MNSDQITRTLRPLLGALLAAGVSSCAAPQRSSTPCADGAFSPAWSGDPALALLDAHTICAPSVAGLMWMPQERPPTRVARSASEAFTATDVRVARSTSCCNERGERCLTTGRPPAASEPAPAIASVCAVQTNGETVLEERMSLGIDDREIVRRRTFGPTGLREESVTVACDTCASGTVEAVQRAGQGLPVCSATSRDGAVFVTCDRAGMTAFLVERERRRFVVREGSVPGEGAILHSYELRRGRVVAEVEYVDGEPISAIRYRYR